jgi:molybdenum cofactor cytidylyltransferase
MRIAGIVLAAGSGSRMGRNKVLLRLGGESLVRHAARVAGEAGLDPVLVVLGYEADLVRAELEGTRCEVVLNPSHALGMSTSLDAGVAAVPEDASAAVVLLADMPFVEAGMVREVVERHRERRARLVTARYGAASAPPTLYARALFPELRGGEGEGRGREVVCRHAAEVVWVDFPESALADLDVGDDVERARARLGEEAT